MLAGKPTGGGEMQGMAGMPGMKGGAETKAPQTSEFVVPVERQQQIGVTYAKVERKPLAHTIRSVGIDRAGQKPQLAVRLARRWLRAKAERHVAGPGCRKRRAAPVDLQPGSAHQ